MHNIFTIHRLLLFVNILFSVYTRPMNTGDAQPNLANDEPTEFPPPTDGELETVEVTPIPESCEILKAVTGVNGDLENFERTVKCSCTDGKIAGTTREKPACVPAYIFEKSSWCDMEPCLEHEKCQEMTDKKGWTCDDGKTTKHVTIENADGYTDKLPTKIEGDEKDTKGSN